MKIQTKWVLPITLISLSCLLAVAMVAIRPDTVKIQPEQRPVLVDVAEVVKQQVRIPILAQGTVTPHRETALVAEVAGKVIEVSPAFYDGGFVAEGEVLLRIDDVEHQANLNRAQAALASAQSSYVQEQGRADVAKQEFKNLAKQHRSDAARELYLRKPQLKQAEAQLVAAQADLRKAEHDLARTVIRAPYASLIQAKQSDLGLYLTPGTPIATLFAVDFAEVRLAVPQSKLAYLDLPGVKAEAEPSKVKVELYEEVAGTRELWRAVLHRTEGVYDERSRVLFTVARVDDPYQLQAEGDEASRGRPLRIGTFVSALIEGRVMEDLVVLPRSVLRTGDVVWVVDRDNALRNREVTLLRTQGDRIFVTGGLQDGDLVCLTPLGSIVAGSKVEVVSRTRSDDMYLLDRLPGESTGQQRLPLAAAPGADS